MALLSHLLPGRLRPESMDTPRAPSSRGRVALALLGFSGVSLFYVFAGAQPTLVSREYEIKAAALFNCIPFAEWPPSAFPSPESPIMIGILGHDPFGPLLDAIVAGETLRGRNVVVQRFRTADAIGNCHVLFVSRSESAQWLRVAHEFARRPILTVGDSGSFARNGGMMEFRIERNRVRIVVNMRSLRESGITLSSRLLRLAEIVGEETAP